MLESSSVFLLLASVLGLVTGMKYMLAKQFFPYHAEVAGKEWPSLEGGVQIVIIGMLKIIGGGFVMLSITLAWFSYAIWKGIPWAPWAILMIAGAGIGPALYVAVRLRSIMPGAKTPVVPLMTGLALILTAVSFDFLALRP